MAKPDTNRTRPPRISAAEFQSLNGRKSPRKPARKQHRWTGALPKGPQKPFRLKLPFLPPSVNKLFTTVRDPKTGVIKRTLTQKARRIRRLVTALIDAELHPGRIYELHLDFHFSAYTRKGTVRRIDLTNRVKFIEDCVCEALGIDDSHIFRVVMNKHDADEELTVVEIREHMEQGGAASADAA